MTLDGALLATANLSLCALYVVAGGNSLKWVLFYLHLSGCLPMLLGGLCERCDVGGKYVNWMWNELFYGPHPGFLV